MNMIHAILTALAIMAIAGIALLVIAIRLSLRHAWTRATLVGVAGFILVSASAAALLLPAREMSCNGSPTHRCMSNLSQIGKACAMYSMDHDEALPTSFLGLTNYLANAKVFVCKSSGHKHGPLHIVDEWTDYILVTNLSAASDSDLVLAYCKPENHKGKGANVLFIDGSVNWVTPDRFHTLSCDIVNHSKINRKKPQPEN